MPDELNEKTFYVFSIGEREFMIPQESVSQILDVIKIFPIPGSPDYIIGAIPVKGKIVPAIDLAKVHNIERISYSENKLLLLDLEGDKIGILSDTTPYSVSFDKDIAIDDYINPKKLFEDLKIKHPSPTKSAETSSKG